MTRTLVLMRHGKSGYPDGVADHERPLAARGRREAALAGAWITENVGTVDAALCSSATRTRETLDATGLQSPTRFEKRIYGGSPDEIIEEITLTDESVSTLLVVGHEPGIPWTALELADPAAFNTGSNNTESPHTRAIRDRFPTSAIAVLTTEQPWSELTNAAVTHFHIPRT